MKEGFIARFADGGGTSPISDIRRGPGYMLIGLAERTDGIKRCVFFDDHAIDFYPDPWIEAIERAA